MDCTSWRSKTGRKVVPPFTDFQTPPLAAPMNTVRRPSSLAAVTAAMRPLMVAEPMLRAGRPETVAASNFTGGLGEKTEDAKKKKGGGGQGSRRSFIFRSPLSIGTTYAAHKGYFWASCFLEPSLREAGTAKSDSGKLTLASILS